MWSAKLSIYLQTTSDILQYGTRLPYEVGRVMPDSHWNLTGHLAAPQRGVPGP